MGEDGPQSTEELEGGGWAGPRAVGGGGRIQWGCWAGSNCSSHTGVEWWCWEQQTEPRRVCDSGKTTWMEEDLGSNAKEGDRRESLDGQSGSRRRDLRAGR